MITITYLFLLGAVIGIIASAFNKCPLWIPVALLAIVVAIGIIPIK